MIQLPPLQQIQEILKDNTTIAVVGLSPKIGRPSNQVAQYMLETGYQIIPVNPGYHQILNQPCYPDLLSVPGNIDIVNISSGVLDDFAVRLIGQLFLHALSQGPATAKGFVASVHTAIT